MHLHMQVEELCGTVIHVSPSTCRLSVVDEGWMGKRIVSNEFVMLLNCHSGGVIKAKCSSG